jgi:hypothetical protein
VAALEQVALSTPAVRSALQAMRGHHRPVVLLPAERQSRRRAVQGKQRAELALAGPQRVAMQRLGQQRAELQRVARQLAALLPVVSRVLPAT